MWTKEDQIRANDRFHKRQALKRSKERAEFLNFLEDWKKKHPRKVQLENIDPEYDDYDWRSYQREGQFGYEGGEHGH